MRQLLNKGYGMFIASLITIIFIIITLSNSTGLIQPRYYEIFYYVFLTATVLSWFVVGFLENNKTTDKVFFFSEARPRFPIFDSIYGKIGAAITLSLMFIAGLTQGLSFLDVPQPFVQESFSVISEGSQLFYKFVFQSLVPGVGEEFVIFISVCVVAYVLIELLGLKKTIGQLILSYSIASGVGAFILMLAHREAYGSDVSAYVGIFVFEFVVQFANLITGMFISWIPHVIHNYAVVFVLATGFSIGGVVLGIKHFKVMKE